VTAQRKSPCGIGLDEDMKNFNKNRTEDGGYRNSTYQVKVFSARFLLQAKKKGKKSSRGSNREGGRGEAPERRDKSREGERERNKKI